MNRRNFIKNSLAIATAAAASPISPLLTELSKASDFQAIADLLNVDSSTLAYKVLSICCQYCMDYFVVSHYQPVAIIEVTKSPKEGLISGGGSFGSAMSAVQGLDNTARNDSQYNSYSARIWEVPDWALSIAMNFMSCKMCGKDLAEEPGSDMSNWDSMKEFACPGSAATTNEMMNMINDQMPDCMPKLLYDTATDADWRYGCRDLDNATLSMTCTIGGDGDSGLGNFIGGLFDDEDPPCIGGWGATYPRQMAAVDSDPRRAAAVAAVRAVSIAKQMGQFKFMTDWDLCKLQQTYPTKQVGYKPGSEDGWDELQSEDASTEGVYAFTWWATVGCCKTMDEIMGFCAPDMNC